METFDVLIIDLSNVYVLRIAKIPHSSIKRHIFQYKLISSLDSFKSKLPPTHVHLPLYITHSQSLPVSVKLMSRWSINGLGKTSIE